MISTSCHCGAIQLEVQEKPLSLTECNCSICHRYGALWAYYTEPEVRVICSEDALGRYSWGDKTIAFCHCKQCGCVTHYEMVKKSANSRLAVNARVMPAESIESTRRRRFDGASTWKYLDD